MLNKEILDVSPGNKYVANLSKKFSALCFLQDILQDNQSAQYLLKGKRYVRSCFEKKTTVSL